MDQLRDSNTTTTGSYLADYWKYYFAPRIIEAYPESNHHGSADGDTISAVLPLPTQEVFVSIYSTCIKEPCLAHLANENRSTSALRLH